jgi:hypothetical protein
MLDTGYSTLDVVAFIEHPASRIQYLQRYCRTISTGGLPMATSTFEPVIIAFCCNF